MINSCFLLQPAPTDFPQSTDDTCFTGGQPKLPPQDPIPACKLCNAEQTFFLQVQFPSAHPWRGFSLAVFECTRCAHEHYLIPQMLPGPLDGADIPVGFLQAYQVNFRFLVFETNSAVIRGDYEGKVRFQRLSLAPSANLNAKANKIGGIPNWILQPEAPSTYAGRMPMIFLLQILPALRFELVPGAPPQTVLALDRSQTAFPGGFYRLFIGNAIYLFGTEDIKEPLVYAITQV